MNDPSSHPFDEILQSHLEMLETPELPEKLDGYATVTESSLWGRKQKDNLDGAINFRATEKEKAAWTDKADSENITLSALIRKTMNIVHGPSRIPHHTWVY